MKRRQTTMILAIAICAVATFQTQTQAQNGPFQRIVPRGRLIQKLRDDLNNGKPFIPSPFAKPAPTPTRAKAPTPGTGAKPTLAQPKKPGANLNSKIKTPQKSPQLIAPQRDPKSNYLGNRNPSSGTTIGSGRKTGSSSVNSLFADKQPTSVRGSFDRSTTNTGSANRITLSDPKSNTDARAVPGNPIFKKIDPLKMKATAGFGLLLEEVKEGTFVVTRIKPGGNGEKAGIKRGDQLQSIGGVEVDSLQLFDEITREMDGGDQLEFVVNRRGKKEKALVQFGELPELDADGQAVAPSAPALPSLAPSNSKIGNTPSLTRKPYQSSEPIGTSRRSSSTDFAPPSSTEGLKSVLESSGSNSASGSLQIDLPALNGPRSNGR